jgi:hypothetical protein
MAWMMVIGPCILCGRIFEFNADRVPSAVVNGKREPLCRACVERANPLRKEKGLPEIRILPGAYEPQEVP